MEEQDNIETNLKTCAEKHCDHLVTRFYGRSGIIYEQCVKKHCKQDDRPDSPLYRPISVIAKTRRAKTRRAKTRRAIGKRKGRRTRVKRKRFVTRSSYKNGSTRKRKR